MNRRLKKHYRLSGVEDFAKPPRFRLRAILGSLAAFVVLCLLHYPLLRLPYYWDEAGYYIPAAMDFYRSGQLVPSSTLPTGHTPLVIIYLALAWRAFGFSPLVTRAAMIVFAACTLTGVYALGRRVANREIGCWSVLLLALSPLFFAQSVLAHLDLAAGLFTLLALLTLLDERPWRFALASTCAVLSKETAMVLLPVAWIFLWWQHRRAASSLPRAWWVACFAPLAVLVAWAGFYHQATGFWTGNHQYLRYNLYSTLNPVRMLLALLRRLYETFVGGFNWLLTAGAIAGIRWAQRTEIDSPQGESHPFARHSERSEESRSAQVSDGRTTLPAQATASEASEESVQNQPQSNIVRRFVFLGGWLTTAYLVMLSTVGGAILPRYLLPIFPPLVLIAVILIWRLPRPAARSIMVFTAGCFVWAWFLNPPYPFPFEDNLAYSDFIRLHEQAAQFLEAQPGNRRILTAWPASDELARPILGYVRQPLNVVAVEGFGRHEFQSVSPESFDCLYLYSRRWEPANNWLRRFPWVQRLQQRYFEYQPQIPEQELVARYHLRLLASFERRRQWVRIYVRQY
jgi:4-amino-4-deoxy-L-arabinose transferase-like glycosyltransferase